MKFYLLEAYSPDLKFENNDYVVALTPLVAYELDKAGIKYSILEDYYDEAEFLKEEEAYFKDQLIWFDEFDNFLFDVFPEAKSKNIKLATSYYYYIKSMLDSLILRCKVINIFIDKARPNSIVFISTRWDKDSISSAGYHWLFRDGRMVPRDSQILFRDSQSLFSRLMPMFCKKYNIDFQRIILGGAEDPKNIHVGNKDFITRIKNRLKTNIYVKDLWHVYKTFSVDGIFPKSLKNHKCNILFLKTGGFVKDIMKEVLKDGRYGVYYKRGSDIIRQFFPYHKVMGHICSNVTSTLKYDIENLPKEIQKTDILNWVNDYCGINISTILLPRMLYFINNFCPQVISLIDKYITFYNDKQIDMVFTPHMVSVDEFAAIIAARYTKKTRSVCLQHGDETFNLKMWDIGEYLPYDIYFTTNNEREEYIKHRIQLGNFNTKVLQYPNRFRILPKVNKPKKKQVKHVAPKTVVYVPTMYQWDNTSWTESRVSTTWYFSWHKELINYFSSRSDYNFIWKALPVSNDTYDPIPNMINDRKYNNIRYATEPFVKWIKKADLVLLDYPSTALYEAAVSGLPVMSLFYAPFNVNRESALKLFGKSLQPFSNFDEGIAKIENFLNSNTDEFVVSIPYSGISILERLDYLKQMRVENSARRGGTAKI